MKRRKPQHANKKPRPAVQSLSASAPILVTIEKPIYGGAFLARAEGKAIFTPLTLPGEQANVRIVDDHRGYATAEADEIVSASPDRVTPACPHFGTCGGCHYQHANYESQLAYKQAVLRETLERGGVATPAEIDVLSAAPWAYRNRIRVAFDTAGNPGYRGRRSHSIVPVCECPIAAPLLVKAALATADYFRALAPAQRPAELTFFCDAQESSLLIGAAVANPANDRVSDFAHAIAAQTPQLTGVEFTTSNVPDRQPQAVARWGESSLTYRAAGFDYRVDHGAFFQVNRWLIDALADHVARDQSGGVAWDLFAGVGLFARRLASSFERVVAVESAPAAMPSLEANLLATSASTVRATILDFLGSIKTERPDLIVVDPPRTGLGADVTSLIARISAPALVYVSCDPATLARDLRALLASGYAIESLTLADLFPQTFHIETVVRLRRA